MIKYCDENKNKIDSELSKLIDKLMLNMTIEQRIILFYVLDEYDYYETYNEDDYRDFFVIKAPEYIIKYCKDNNIYHY